MFETQKKKGNNMEITDNARNRMFSNKDLVRLIIPLIIEQMLTVTVGLADSIMTAYVGEEAVSGVSLVDSVMVLMINLFSALATALLRSFSIGSHAALGVFMMMAIASPASLPRIRSQISLIFRGVMRTLRTIALASMLL